MSDNYESLLERSVRAQEQSSAISNSLLEVSKRMEENIKSLNDSFVLHASKTNELCDNVQDIKSTLLKWIKVLIIALFVAVGGTQIIQFLLNSKLL